MTRCSSRRSKGASSARVWVGRGLVAVGIVLGAFAALGGSVVAGVVLALVLAAVGGALIWIARGVDARAVARRRRAAGILALGLGGAFFGLVGVAMRASGEQDGTFVMLGGVTAGAIAGLWWMATRNSRAPDLVHGPVQLGDGRLEAGRVVTMPRSKRVALVTGAMLMGLVFVVVAPAMLDDGDPQGWFLGGLGVFILVVGGPLLVPTALHDASLSVSGTGVTIRFRASHYTVPWEAVERAGIFEFTTYHRGIKHTHRQLGIAADLDRALGSVRSRDRRAAQRGSDASGWAVTFPQTVFDLHIEDIATLVNDAHPAGRAAGP